MSDATMAFVGPAIGVTQISYDITSGIATVGTGITAHGLLAGSKIKLVGAGQTVYKGVFGTKSTNHVSGTQIKKVRVVPVESRRNSLIRAANQTFEYVGFGQGNYSVALP